MINSTFDCVIEPAKNFKQSSNVTIEAIVIATMTSEYGQQLRYLFAN